MELTDLFNAEKQHPWDTGSGDGLVYWPSATTAYSQKEFLSSHCETGGPQTCAHNPHGGVTDLAAMKTAVRVALSMWVQSKCKCASVRTENINIKSQTELSSGNYI